MKWYHVIDCDNAVANPYVADTGELIGTDQENLWGGITDYLFGPASANQNLGSFASGTNQSPYSGGASTGFNPRLFK